MNNNKSIKTINTLYVFILFVLGIYFGKIRSELFDGADRLYEAIAFKHNFFGHYRFSTAINGILPWIIAQLGGSPEWILYGFILNYALTPAIVFLILRYYFKDEYLISFYLISLSLFYTLTFFHPNHDILIGFYYLTLLYSYLKHTSPDNKYYYVVVFILCILLSFTHLTQIPCAIVLLVYLNIYQKKDYPVLKIGSLLGIAVLIKVLFFSSGYEKGIIFRILEFKDRLEGLLYSPLIITFIRSFYTINIVVTGVLILTSYLLIKAHQKRLLFFIVAHMLLTLLYITFFFPEYPYTFGTEGYLKGANILLSIAFLDFFLYHATVSQRIKTVVLGSIYAVTLIIILLNGINYKIYYNNLKQIANNLNKNTIYVSPGAEKLEHYYILHRHTALINTTENDKCYYFQYISDSTNYINEVLANDIKNNKLCFGEKAEMAIPDTETKRVLDKQYFLIFDLTNLKTRFRFNEYTYHNVTNTKKK
ncbi:MAG: hypothetical protein U0T77_01580 [Chitinophagales bacterium]